MEDQSDYLSNHRRAKELRFQGHSVVSDQIDAQGLGVVQDSLADVLRRNVPGDIVEFGCYVGTTSLFLRRQLNEAEAAVERELHVYDSFVGLPQKTAPDESTAGSQFQSGELRVSKAELLKQFQKAGLQPPIIHKGWFADLTAADVPSDIAFAFLDGDFYGSIMDSLQLVWPRLNKQGIIVIDDYQRVALPGVERAVQTFFKATPIRLQQQHNVAIIRPA